jgi:hypothetical protein
VYPINGTFTLRVTVNTNGQSINAAEGTLNFNPRELAVVRVDRSASVFSLWVTEPSFSNSAGTISFSGGSPTGYTGSSGTVFTVTMRTLTAGESRLSYTSGSVLANDGRGTNVLSSMSGGTFTAEAATSQPAPEVVIEYVPQANTPSAPKITSTSHPDTNSWYTNTTAELAWTLPSDVTGMRTLLDKNPNSIPSKVYDTPQTSLTLKELEEGVSYFHLQFRNDDGWGRVTHYRLGIDTKDPVGFKVNLASSSDPTNPEQVLVASFGEEEVGSPISRYLISINGGAPVEFVDSENSGRILLPSLEPGYHTISIEAVDGAGNSTVDSLSLTIASFEKPVFSDYPEELTANVIPVIKGLTRPGSEVTVYVSVNGVDERSYQLEADESGVFTYIPDSPLVEGVYKLRAVATDTYGARSESSDEIRIAVQQPGYIRIGTWLVSALSVIIPALGLVALMVLMVLWLGARFLRFKGRVSVESHEALTILDREFNTLREVIGSEKEKLASTKRSKNLSVGEQDFITALEDALLTMQKRVVKEVKDVENLVAKDK